MSAKHTPGPWVWIAPLAVLNSAHGKIFDSAAYEGMWFDQDDRAVNEANARLIAAAPDLYEALDDADSQMETAGDCIEAGRYDEALLHVRSMVRVRRAALAKARGEA